MNSLKDIHTIAGSLALYESPIVKMIRQQQEIEQKFRSISKEYLGAFQHTGKLANFSKLGAFSTLEPLRQIALGFHESKSTLAVAKGIASQHSEQMKLLGMTLRAAQTALSSEQQGSLSLSTRRLKELSKVGILSTFATIPLSALAVINDLSASQAKLKTLAGEISKNAAANVKALEMARGLAINTLHSKLTALSRTLSDQTYEFTAAAIADHQWEAIEDFGAIHSQAIDITEAIVEPNEALEEAATEIRSLIKNIGRFISKHSKVIETVSFVIFNVFMNFADLHQYWAFLTEKKEEFASKDDVLKIRDELKVLREDLNKKVSHKIVVHRCSVFLKPKLKSRKLNKLQVGVEVLLLDTRGKWVYISFNDATDNLPQTGWVLKKYLRKE